MQHELPGFTIESNSDWGPRQKRICSACGGVFFCGQREARRRCENCADLARLGHDAGAGQAGWLPH